MKKTVDKCSEPTVWDGDILNSSISKLTLNSVLSPLRGMETVQEVYHRRMCFWIVLSPPCGMKTDMVQACSPTHGLFPVLSPLGGMVPVARFLLLPSVLVGQGSKLTVWDEDLNSFLNLSISTPSFQAHRVGWWRARSRHSSVDPFDSEPTVWDRDAIFKASGSLLNPNWFRAHWVGWWQWRERTNN